MSDERRVEVIVSRAIGPRSSVRVRFVRLARALGWSGLFSGAGARLAGAAIVAAVAATLAVAAAPGSMAATLAVGPILLLLLTALVDGADRVGPLAPLRRSVLFTVAEVTAVRVVVFAVLGFVFAAVVAAAAIRPEGASASALIAEACAATAVAGVAVLVLLSRGWDRVVIALPAVWIAVVALPAAVWAKQWEVALQAVPVAAWATTAAIGVVVFGTVDGLSLRHGRGGLHAAGF